MPRGNCPLRDEMWRHRLGQFMERMSGRLTPPEVTPGIPRFYATSMALDVNGVSTADGANVQIWTYGGGNNQQWTFQAP